MLVGILLALGASVSWTVANVAIQRSGRAVGPFRAMLWAQVTSGAGLAVLALLLDRPTAPFDGATVVWGLVGGLAALLAYVCLFYSFERASLSIAVPIMSSWSVIAAGIGVGLLGERLSVGQIAGAALVFTGVILVAVQPRTGGNEAAGGRAHRRTVMAAFGAAVGFGVLIPVIDHLSSSVGTLGAIPFVYGIELVLGLPLALAARVRLGPPPASAWAIVVAAGLAETLGFAFVSLGATRAPVAVISPTASLATTLTVLYAWLVLHERPTRVAALGAGLACCGVVLLAL